MCGVAAHLIDGPADIDLGWFSGEETVVITAGASAPRPWSRSASSLLQERFGASVETRVIRQEQLRFALPKPLRKKPMKINDLEFYLVAVGQTDSAAPVRSLLVRITTASGLEGWGESGLGWRVGELAARREALLAVLAGRSIYDIEELHTLEALAPPPLRSAVEMAVWDLLGRVLRQPLCNLLGGYYRRRVPVSVRLAGRRAETVAQISRELAEQGFHTQTIASQRPARRRSQDPRGHPRDGGRPDRAAVRRPGPLRPGNRPRPLRRHGVPGLQFFLDPLNAPELHPVASLGRQTSVPLAVWRAIRGPADVLTAVRCSAAPFVVIDLEQVGGIVPARACAAIAAAAGVVPVLGGRASVGIATAAMLHLAAATAAFSTGNEIASGQLRDTVLTDSFEIADGMMAVPQSHGLGVEVDRAKVERYQAGENVHRWFGCNPS